MTPNEPRKTCNVIGSLDLQPVNASAEYFISLDQEKSFVNPTNWDMHDDTIERIMLYNTIEHQGMLQLQKNMLASDERQRIKNNNRKRAMYKMQEQLRHRFINVNGFLKDCDSKQRIAEKTVDQEILMSNELRKNIDYVRNSINVMTEFREDLKKTVLDYMPYERIIDEVVAKSDIYTSPQDCMERCDALMLAQTEINKFGMIKIREIELMRQRMIYITNDAALKVLGFKNDLAKLMRSYNNLRSLVSKYERILATTKKFVSDKELDKERTLDAIHKLYEMLCLRSGVNEPLGREAVAPKLDFILSEFHILQKLLQEMGAQNSDESQEKTAIDTQC